MKLLVAGGGTGGHIFPGIAIAEEFKRLADNPRVIFVGTANGMERDLVPAAGFSLHLIPGAGFKGKAIYRKVLSLLKLPLGFMGAIRILNSFAPDVVLGVGGYAAFTVCLVARIMGIKVIIEEQNAIPGLTNRLLGKIVNWVAITFPSSQNYFPVNKSQLTGLPLRQNILSVPPLTTLSDNEVLNLLIVGGSQGARTINQALMQAVPRLKNTNLKLNIRHQTGKLDEQMVREAYAAANIKAQVEPFITDMASAYQQAHLVIARAGASIMEIAACGRAMILVPYPYAADDHQAANAAYFKESQAAWVVANDEFKGEKAAELIISLNADRSKLLAMASQALQLARRSATTEIAQACIRLGTNEEVQQHA